MEPRFLDVILIWESWMDIQWVELIKDLTIILQISSFKHTHQKFILISNNMTSQDPILLEWIAQNAHLHHILNLMQLLLILHMVFELWADQWRRNKIKSKLYNKTSPNSSKNKNHNRYKKSHRTKLNKPQKQSHKL